MLNERDAFDCVHVHGDKAGGSGLQGTKQGRILLRQAAAAAAAGRDSIGVLQLEAAVVHQKTQKFRRRKGLAFGAVALI